MFRFFSTDYTEINITIDKQNIDEQMAHIRMEDIRNYRSYFMLPSSSNTKNILVFISNALETPLIQTNSIHLETLWDYLTKIDKDITYYENISSKGLYKWLFWSSSPADLVVLRKQTNDYLNRVLEFKQAISQVKSPYYQQSDHILGNNSV